jgi:serine protease inhibitor
MTIMKMSQLRSLAVTACLSLVLLCHIDEVSGQPSALIYNQRDFADDVLRSLYTRDNECSSMLGLSMAFGLLYPSAVGESLTEMQQVFGFPPTEGNLQLVWSDTQNSLEATLNGNCSRAEFQNEQIVCLDGEPLLKIANIVWVPRLNGLNETYKRVVGNLVEEMDFNDENTGSRVNRWVSDATNGLISRIVNDGPLGNIVLLAVNTIYLKAQWAKPFAPSDTNNDQFYTTASRTTPLTSTAHFSEYHTDMPS